MKRPLFIKIAYLNTVLACLFSLAAMVLEKPSWNTPLYLLVTLLILIFALWAETKLSQKEIKRDV